MNKPNFRTINRFRSEKLTDGRFESIFHQVVELLHDEGLISLDVQYIDGTKIESVAHNLKKYVAQKTKDRDRYAQSMAGRGLVSGSMTTKSEGWMKQSGILEEPSGCDFAILYNNESRPFWVGFSFYFFI